MWVPAGSVTHVVVALGADVAGLVVEFPGVCRWDLDDAAAVRGWCVEVSSQFAQLCAERGVPAQLIHGAHFGELEQFPGVRLLLGAHSAVWLTGCDVVVDWTAHQFDPVAPVPVVEPVDAWRARWVPVGGGVST